MADAFASDFDETDVFDDTSLSLAQDSFAVEGSARPTGLTLAEAGSFENADTALAGLSDFVKQQQGQGRALGLAAVESGDYSGIKNKDINKLRRDDKNVTDYYTESVDNNIIDFVNDNNIPLYKDVNGRRVYLNTGTEGSLTGIAKEGSDVTYETYGPVGTYSSIAVPKARGIVAAFPPELRTALALMTGGMSEAVLAAAAGLAGDTLHTADWLNLAKGAIGLYQQNAQVPAETGTGPSRSLEEMAQDPNSGVMSATGVGGATDAVDTASTVASRSTAIGDAAVNAAFDSGKLIKNVSTAADAQSVADAAINTYRNSAQYFLDIAKDNAGLLKDIGSVDI